MLKLLLLLLVVGSARGHPFLGKCTIEHEKVFTCQNEVINKFGQVFLPNFELNGRAILEFERCLGPISCQITQLRLELFNQKQKMYQKFKSISCLNDFIYRSAQIPCLHARIHDCEMNDYLDCVANRLLLQGSCNNEETNYFKSLAPDFEKHCQLKNHIKLLKTQNKFE